MPRIISWFSCGAASAVASYLILKENKESIIVNIPLDNEHEDNKRFQKDCSVWYEKKIVEIRSKEYVDCWDVWEKTRFLNSPYGARCTTELKKIVRREFTLEDDIQVFGFTFEEKDRAERFKANNPEVNCRFPLIEQEYSKRDCFLVLEQNNISIPKMYLMGYNNANCIGCVKGGMGYWNKIRVDFPEIFNRMAELEKTIGHSCIKNQPLITLDPTRGSHKDLELPDCGLFCGQY
jgi:hypothetical protein